MILKAMEPQPAAFSCRMEIPFDSGIPGTELEAKISLFLSELTRGLRKQGCRLIGHIKGLMDAGKSGHLMFSITSFDETVNFKGEIKQDVIMATLTLNIIVYGIEKRDVDTLFRNAFDHAF